MADVKRYEKRVNPINGDVYMACVPDGAYVLYSDYEALSHAAWQDGEQCRAASGFDLVTAMESWRGALDSAKELAANAPDERYRKRASDVVAYLMTRAPNADSALSRGVPEGKCWCLTCDPVTVRMALCPDCGNKRCPKANDHRNACTNSNEPGQPGSAYPAAIAAQRKEGE